MYKASIPGVYDLQKPGGALPLVFDSPHSGTIYPEDFDYACDYAVLESAEDKYVDDLFADVPDHGAALLCALFPRTYIDVNRCEKDIDHDLLEDIWPEESNPSPRSFAGIGLIRRLIRPGTPVYNRTLKAEEVRARIEKYYRPYHQTLENLIHDAQGYYGQVWHINCHSMPSQSAFQNALGRANPFRTPDFVLGDRGGTTCDPDFIHAIRDYLKNLGYRVAINDPYKGVELVRRYSAPAQGRHSLQIEINKALYMNEDTCRKLAKYDVFKRDINRLIGFCTDYVSARLVPLAAD